MKPTPKVTKATTKGEPLARKDDLIIKEMPDEVLVYDLVRDQAHCLNRTAALVWNYSDGRTNAATMAGRLTRELNVRPLSRRWSGRRNNSRPGQPYDSNSALGRAPSHTPAPRQASP